MTIKQILIGSKERPINFGIGELAEIQNKYGIDPANVLTAIHQAQPLETQIGIILTGIKGGAKAVSRAYASPPDEWAAKLTADLLEGYMDDRNEILDEGFAAYCEQTFGKSVAQAHELLEKAIAATTDEQAKADAQQNLDASKNGWAKIVERAAALTSLELPKLA
jgi:hypothetical protein